jgi:short-subunit dehydrogenase
MHGRNINLAVETIRQFAVVTGASSGIGYELAKQFAQNNFDVLLVSAGERINTAATDISSFEPGVDVKILQADLATHEGVHELISTINSAGRPIDAIALNAGVGVSGPFRKRTLKKS